MLGTRHCLCMDRVVQAHHQELASPGRGMHCFSTTCPFRVCHTEHWTHLKRSLPMTTCYPCTAEERAEFSADRTCRWSFSVRFKQGALILWVMHNPSTG